MAVEALQQSQEHKAAPREESERFIVPTDEQAITEQPFDYRRDGAGEYERGDERASEQEIELSLDS